MEVVNLLHLSSRSELRRWLEENHNKEKCCWVVTYRSKCPEWSAVPYIEVVEEALCFGWIDSTLKRLSDGRLAQRLSPRRPKSHWTQLNMDRCIDLEDRGLMTEAGRRLLKRHLSMRLSLQILRLVSGCKRRINSNGLGCMNKRHIGIIRMEKFHSRTRFMSIG